MFWGPLPFFRGSRPNPDGCGAELFHSAEHAVHLRINVGLRNDPITEDTTPTDQWIVARDARPETG